MSPRAQRTAQKPTAAAGSPERPNSAFSTPLEFRLLGTLEVRRGGEPLALGGARPRALLACLLLGRERVVSVDELVDGLWGESAPRTARHMVEVYVSKLRKLLGENVLLTRPPGYLLQPERERVDVERFERLVAEGGEALAREDAARASTSLAAALGLWRGAALADFTYEPFAQAEIARLEELRLVALEERIEAELALGRHAELVGELEALVAKHPYRERPRGQLMLALYRAGRQADALSAYRTARETLVEELGVEPGPDLRRLEQAILAQEEWLASPDVLLQRAPEARETRKLLTVLFAEPAEDDPALAGADLEALQPLMRERLQGSEDVLLRHGATVERSPDGTLMGIFGSPTAHEDDALRSLRAAAELRQLGVVSRVGIETGEALAGGEPLVSGPVVRAAGRLLAAAQPGDVLVGEATRRLTLGSAHFESLAGDGVGARRLLDLVAGAPVRALRLDAPLVGREDELAELREAYTRAVRERRPNLVTVIGEPGIGKTRLAREFVELLDGEARILTGRCLAYGEGITYRPLREVVGEAAGEESAEALEALLASVGESEEIARRLAGAVGFLEEVHPLEEIRWAARRLFEALAGERPLVLVFDDVHWAEPTFLDLLRHVLALGRDAPILLLCLARRDLLEEHPEWLQPEKRTSILSLGALAPAAAEELVSELDANGALAQHRREHVIRAAEGNPLFLEQLVAFAVETRRTGDKLELPPTLRALLAARLDRLGPGERAVLECAAVVGREFWTSAVGELLPVKARVTLPRHLDALKSKSLIEPEPSTLSFEDAFRFRHVLLQEAGYRALSKTRRADLHQRVVAWVERIPAGVIGDQEEIIGYHLEQASLLLAELGSSRARAEALAHRASDLLMAAAHRAAGRGDYRAASGLLRRARALLTPCDKRLQALGVALAEALYATGELKQAEALLRETRQLAAARGDTRTEWLAIILHVRLKDHLEPKHWNADEVRRTAQQALAALERLEADRSLAQAWLLLGYVDWNYCRHEAATKSYERGLACVRQLEDEHTERLVVQNLIAALYHGPMPASEAIARIEELTAEAGSRTLEPFALVRLAGLHTMQGRFDEGRALYERSKAMFQELGLALSIATGTMNAREIHLLAGDAEGAELELRWGYEILEQMGEKGRRSTLAASLAEALYHQRRYEEAERFARESLGDASPEDVASQVLGRMVTAKLLAVKGMGDRAEQNAREAEALAEKSDDLFMLGGANLALAEVLLLADKREEAIRALEAAVDASDRKGNIVSAHRARALLTELER